ncbi:inner membrane protein [Klebsiella pneumoniae]|uniref:Inner membrane protein n=1 Tax=Klebsiella pneumoniae TaxID=573 RepID=A0A378F7W8_KLEPN|nr:inner membrane protein [Klebsiella pneumoniae]
MVQHPLCPRQLIDRILQSPDVDSEQKAQLKKMVATKGELSFYDVFTLTRAGAAQ